MEGLLIVDGEPGCLTRSMGGGPALFPIKSGMGLWRPRGRNYCWSFLRQFWRNCCCWLEITWKNIVHHWQISRDIISRKWVGRCQHFITRSLPRKARNLINYRTIRNSEFWDEFFRRAPRGHSFCFNLPENTNNLHCQVSKSVIDDAIVTLSNCKVETAASTCSSTRSWHVWSCYQKLDWQILWKRFQFQTAYPN